MTTLLEQAFAEAALLPADEQDALAAWIIEELRNGNRWQPTLSHSVPPLEQLADETTIAEQARTTDVPKLSREEQEYAENFAIGRRECLLESIHYVLQVQFGYLGLILFPEIRRIADVDRLLEICGFVMSASSPSAVRAAFPEVDYPKARTSVRG